MTLMYVCLYESVEKQNNQLHLMIPKKKKKINWQIYKFSKNGFIQFGYRWLTFESIMESMILFFLV